MARFKFVTIATIAMVLAVSFEYGVWKKPIKLQTMIFIIEFFA